MTLLDFLAGMITFGYGVAGLFFLGFWRRTGDGLFIAFSLAFSLLGIHQALLTFSSAPVEERSGLYLIRLLAFLLIIISILWKNRRRSA
jgi:hypothetical protein